MIPRERPAFNGTMATVVATWKRYGGLRIED